MGIAGNLEYMAPELVSLFEKGQQSAHYDPTKADMYSLGRSVLKLLNLELADDEFEIGFEIIGKKMG